MSYPEKQLTDKVEYVETKSAMESSKFEIGAAMFDGMGEEEIRTFEKNRTNPTLDLASSANIDAVVRNIDFHLIASLFGLFIFNILDRANIANARLGGLQSDLNLSDAQYQTAVSILVNLAYLSILASC